MGVNTASAPPAVPKAFVWEDAKSNTSLLAMWHPHGYGGISVSDCVLVPGSTHALAFAFRSDNAGPPDLAELKVVKFCLYSFVRVCVCVYPCLPFCSWTLHFYD